MDEINWGELGKDWWFEQGATAGCSEQQIIFAACRHKGMTATGAARAAGYGGDETSIRQSGHRAAHSTGVMALLAMAKAETAEGPDGNVTMAEAKQILSRLARGSDPNVRIKAIESLAKIERDEREFEARQKEPSDPITILRELASISPAVAALIAKEQGLEWPLPAGPDATASGNAAA